MSEGPDAAPDPPGVDPDEGWQHFHPLSPLLRGGVAFVAVVGYVGSQQLDRIVGGGADDPTEGHRLLAVGIVALVLLAIIAGSWVTWRVSRFRLGPAMLELRTGVLFRQHRQVHFDRIQAVDLGRPVLARLTGLSEVVVQSAGGRDSTLRLSFLTDARAREVREQLMALAGRTDEATWAPGVPSSHGSVPGDPAATSVTAGPGPVPTGHEVLRVPNARLVQSTLYHGSFGFLVLAVPVLVGGLLLGVGELVGWLVPMVLGIGGRHLGSLVRNANFTLHHQGDRLLVRHGLTDLRSTSVPLHRIQAAELVQPVLWRFPGWWQVRVNVAGAGSEDGPTESLLLPVGTREEALAVLGLVRPGIPAPLAVAALEGEGPDHGFTVAPSRVRPVDPLSWRRRGYAVTQDCVLVRAGALRRRLQVVPHARVQSLTLDQGPLQRRLGVATVDLVSTPGPVRARVHHLGTPDAQRLVREQIVRSGRARQRV